MLTRTKNMKIIPIARFSSEIPQPQHFWIFFSIPHMLFFTYRLYTEFFKFQMIYLWYLGTYLNSEIIQVNFNKAILSTLSFIYFPYWCWSRC